EKFATHLRHQVRAIESPVAHESDQKEEFLESLSSVWVGVGYALFAIIALNGFLRNPWFPINSNNIFWTTAMWAATLFSFLRPG
ncbi:MAG: hypothetical protein AAGA56_12410, partial [Myxococcota bacterium]